MDEFAALPDGWTVWSDEPDGRVVLVYRPDVFDGQAHPAACLPTIYLTNGPRDNRRPRSRMRPAERDTWHVTLTLEPEVTHPGGGSFDDREAAVEAAVELARQFDDGKLDLRGVYQVPREGYLETLAGLVGEEDPATGEDEAG